MCDLGGWDGAMEISGQALADLAVALDQSVRPTIDSYPASSLDVFEGLTINGAEQLLNQELLVPRVLYATVNPDFDPGPGRYPGADDDLERLHARFQEYYRLTDIQPVSLRPPRFQVNGDPAGRLTFARGDWYNGTSVPPDIVLQPPNSDGNVRPNTVRLRFSGKVLIGPNFVDGATVLNSPEALDFTMELDYVVRLGTGSYFPLNQLNVGLGSLPFSVTTDPCPTTPVVQRLPPQPGRPIWAQNLGTPCVTDWLDIPAGVRWRLTDSQDIENGTATLFTGAPGDCILDPDTGQERWVVKELFREPVSWMGPPDNADALQSLPRRVLMDFSCDLNRPYEVAEAGKSFALLTFDRIFAISISPYPELTVEHRAAINRSIMKLDGFLLGLWLNQQLQQACQDAGGSNCPPPPNPQQLALLALLGPQAMNVAPLPGELTLPFAPQFITGDGVPYVQSEVLVLRDAATQVFPSANGDSGALALGGCFLGVPQPAEPLPENFTHAPNASNAGQDIAIGLSQQVVNRWLKPAIIEPQIRRQLAKEVEGFDEGEFRLDVALARGRFDIHVRGAGALDLDLIDLPYDFAVDFPLRLRAQPAVARLNSPGAELNGMPVDAAGFPLPEDLSCIGMNLARGDFIANSPANNPLCFLGYHDPRVPGANLLYQPGGPWVRVSGEGGGCPTCTLGSDICPVGPQVPAAFLWREVHFPVPPFPCPFGSCVSSLRPGLELAFLPPDRGDVDVDVDFAWWADLIVGLFAGPLVGFNPHNTLVITSALADLLATQTVTEGLRGGVAGTTPLMPNFTLGWQFFLQHSDPTVPSNDAFKIEPGSMCLLFRVLVGPDPRLGNWAAAAAAAAGL